jgi:hypothetical protein
MATRTAAAEPLPPESKDDSSVKGPGSTSLAQPTGTTTPASGLSAREFRAAVGRRPPGGAVSEAASRRSRITPPV